MDGCVKFSMCTIRISKQQNLKIKQHLKNYILQNKMQNFKIV